MINSNITGLFPKESNVIPYWDSKQTQNYAHSTIPFVDKRQSPQMYFTHEIYFCFL